MEKKDILDKYFLEELEEKKEKRNLCGWKILGEIPTSYYLGLKKEIRLKTKSEGWLDEFEIILHLNTGLVIVSPECPQCYIDDVIERDIIGIISQIYIVELGSTCGLKLSNEPYSPYKIWSNDNISGIYTTYGNVVNTCSSNSNTVRSDSCTTTSALDELKAKIDATTNISV